MNILTPIVTCKNEELLLLTPQTASIQAKRLKSPVGSLSHFRDEIIAAVDFVVTGI